MDNNYTDFYSSDDQVINGESLNFDSTIDQVSNSIMPGQTLILDIGNNYFNQADELYNTLYLKGYEVRKTFRNGRNQLIVHKRN